MSIRRFRIAIMSFALAGVCLPTSGWATDTNALPAPQIADVALRDGGVLVGQLVDGQNAPKSDIRISLQDTQNREIGASVTNKQGYFSMSEVRGGVYQLVTPQGRQVYRLWSPGVAPPSAQPGILLVAQGDTVRGALGNGTWKSILTNPVVIGGAVATAVAVPIIVANQRRPASP